MSLEVVREVRVEVAAAPYGRVDGGEGVQVVELQADEPDPLRRRHPRGYQRASATTTTAIRRNMQPRPERRCDGQTPALQLLVELAYVVQQLAVAVQVRPRGEERAARPLLYHAEVGVARQLGPGGGEQHAVVAVELVQVLRQGQVAVVLRQARQGGFLVEGVA